ncbi:MAG: class I SAM-dependent methyltransferase [Chromatiales bacterium]|nr:class I SAM-dependent methyltransferase [Chromatiales bacterium]
MDNPAASLFQALKSSARRLGIWRPGTRPGWSGGGMVATLNGTGFMFEIRDRFADAFIRDAGELGQQGKHSLEVGCAYGVSTLPALEAGALITASDIEPRHLEILRGKVPRRLLPNLELVPGALPHMDLPREKYGAILCSRVLHFLAGDDVDASVRKMAAWLAPGGRLYLVADTPYGVWRGKIPEFEAGRARGERWPGMMVGLHNYLAGGNPGKPIEKPPFMNLLDPDLLARACTEAGLAVVDAAFISRPDFAGLGRMDGRENAGVLALKPA